jgi:hypothetical protein
MAPSFSAPQPDSNPFPELLMSLVEDRVTKTLADLVVSYRNGQLTEHAALTGIGTIAALRLLPFDLAARLKHTK